MKKVFILLTVLGLLATPAMAGTHLEKGSVHHKHAARHVTTKHQKKQQKKKLSKKLAKRNARKHKVAV